MNKQFISFMIILIILTLACNSLIKPTLTTIPPPERGIIHFENEIVAFDHLAGVHVFTDGNPAFITYPGEIQLGGELVVGLAHQNWLKNEILFSSIGVFRYPILPGSSINDVMRVAYEGATFPGGTEMETLAITIDDLPAMQKTYRVASGPLWYTLRDIWLEKDDSVIRVSIWEEAYAIEFQSTMDMFMNTLDMKDNLPPIGMGSTVQPTSSPTPFSASMILHFENDVVAFDYLNTMKIHTDPEFKCYPDFQLGGEWVVGLGDPKFIGFDDYFRSIRIFRQQIPAGSSLEAIMLDVYRKAEGHFPQEAGVLNANGVITVSGSSALQQTYRVYSGEPAYELRDIWIQMEDELFIIAVWTEYTNPDDFAAFQAGADLLLNSLHIK